MRTDGSDGRIFVALRTQEPDPIRVLQILDGDDVIAGPLPFVKFLVNPWTLRPCLIDLRSHATPSLDVDLQPYQVRL